MKAGGGGGGGGGGEGDFWLVGNSPVYGAVRPE